MNPTTEKKKIRGGVIALICVLLIVVLLVKPTGILGRAIQEKV